MTTDEYLEINGMTEDDMEDEYMNALKSEMVMWAIVEKEGLANKITDEDIQNKWDELYQEGDFESEEDIHQLSYRKIQHYNCNHHPLLQ